MAKTAEEKKKEGNRSRRGIKDDPVVEPILSISPPRGMPKEQKYFWKCYAPYMVKNRLLTDLNKTDLARLCYFEAQLNNIHEMLSTESASLLQEKKNYHGDVVDLIEGVYSKMSRSYTATIRMLKADLRIRTDKVKAMPEKKQSKFDGLIGKK